MATCWIAAGLPARPNLAVRVCCASYAVPRAFALLTEEFTVENGLLTPKMSMKRPAIEKRHAATLEKLHTQYNNGA